MKPQVLSGLNLTGTNWSAFKCYGSQLWLTYFHPLTMSMSLVLVQLSNSASLCQSTMAAADVPKPSTAHHSFEEPCHEQLFDFKKATRPVHSTNLLGGFSNEEL